MAKLGKGGGRAFTGVGFCGGVLFVEGMGRGRKWVSWEGWEV